MNNYIKYFLAFVLSFFMFSAFAQNPATIADVKSNVISSLQKDGYLSEKMANEAANKYITPQDVQSRISISTDGTPTATTVEARSTVNWTQYLSWINFVKVLGVVLLFVAFWGVIKKIIKSAWHIIASVPVIIYQVVFMSATVYGTVFPEKIWVSQAFYIALFCSFANLLILGWIIDSYKQVQIFFAKLFNLGLPPATIASFWGMIYFATLAIVYQSSIFGFFAAIALSGIFTFTLIYSPGVLFLYFKENALVAVVFGHIAVLATYVAVYHSGIAEPHIQYFNAGIQYYCSIALGVGLLVGASPFYKPQQAIGYALLCVLVGVAATVLYFFLGMTTISTTLFIFFALIFIEWIGYMGFQGGWIIGCGTVGGMLYGISMMLESYGPAIMNNMKTVLG